ncbi:MAG: hypothetical protein JJE46_08805 [Acidimicrobiia bacterium]|nr:hypothetical protein [Acidimicrobiia bacterium]
MSRLIRRGAIAATLASLGYAAWKFLAARRPDTAGLTFQAQPFPLPPKPIPVSTSTTARHDAAVDDRSIAPDPDGDCPVTHPIKGKHTSGIYHQPGGFAYERTHADRCYRDTTAAEDDGLRAAKR